LPLRPFDLRQKLRTCQIQSQYLANRSEKRFTNPDKSM
jgi:hypothetical protein